MMPSDYHPAVSFNVGGQSFTTLRETLLKEGNSRLALIARGLLATIRDPATGAFVIDRDPKYFQIILNFLRDGWCRLPHSAEERRELLQEVRYYQLAGFEGWLRTQELLAETGAPQAQELLGFESPTRSRSHATGLQPHASPHTAYPSYNAAYQGYPSPSLPPPGPTSPRAAAVTGAFTTGGRVTSSAWPSPAGFSAPSATVAAGLATGTAASLLAPSSAGHSHTHPHHLRSAGPHAFSSYSQQQQQQHQHSFPQQQHQQSQSVLLAAGSPARPLSAVANGGGGLGAGPGPDSSTWGGGSAAGSGAGGAIASLREAFLAATGPQRPAQQVAPYSLPLQADDSGSWTSKYLKGNEGLRELVNTLLELAFLAPHRVLHSGKSHISISVACSHGQEASLVGNKEEHMRSKLMEVRVRGALGWAFELTLRPSSDVALWDKYGGVAAAVQDNWFVLGAILKDQFGVVLEEDAAARPACVACRRTCLALTLNKIY